MEVERYVSLFTLTNESLLLRIHTDSRANQTHWGYSNHSSSHKLRVKMSFIATICKNFIEGRPGPVAQKVRAPGS